MAQLTLDAWKDLQEHNPVFRGLAVGEVAELYNRWLARLPGQQCVWVENEEGPGEGSRLDAPASPV